MLESTTSASRVNPLPLPSRNGHASRRPSKPAAKPRSGSRRSLRAARRLALLVGGVGTGVLALSVHHCTESISLLTGSHWALSGLLAVGIDAGMVSSEVAGVAALGTKAQATVSPWCRGYVVAAVLLSVLLNGYAFSLHSAPGMVWASWVLGAAVPAGVLALGRIASALWHAGE